MSILSSPQGTPERVWSLVCGLAAASGELSREDFASVLNPGFRKDGTEVKAKASLADNAVSVAASLGITERDGNLIRLAPGFAADDYPSFADKVHDILCAKSEGDVDAVMLEAFAWLLAESQRRQDTAWIYLVGSKEFADLASAALHGEDDEGRPMNPTKLPAWRRWLRFLGLGTSMPGDAPDYPSVAERISLELQRAAVPIGTVFSAEDFVALIALRCPYLDRGRLFVQACQRITYHPPPRGLSPVLSVALRSLDAEGVIQMQVAGDAGNALFLAPDPTNRISTFTSVTIVRGDPRD